MALVKDLITRLPENRDPAYWESLEFELPLIEDGSRSHRSSRLVLFHAGPCLVRPLDQLVQTFVLELWGRLS